MKREAAASLALLAVPLLTVALLALAGCPSPSQTTTPSTKPTATRSKAPVDPAADAPPDERSSDDAPAAKPADPAAKPVDNVAHSVDSAAKPAKPVDPVAENGQIFEDWPKPKLALVLTGNQDGYIEPCGCTGREHQKGGMARRHSFLKQLAADGWPTVALDVGGVADRFGRQAEIKYQILIEAMQTMGYDAIGFGPKDLRLPAEGLVAVSAGEKSPLVAANVNLFGLTQPFRVIEAGGMKVGVTSILGDNYQKEINNDQITFTKAETALELVVPKLQAAGCDVLVLLAHAEREEADQLAAKFPQFNVVVTSQGHEEPPHIFRRLEGKPTLMIEVGTKGKYAIVLGFYDDPKDPIRYQRVPLDARFPDSPDMVQLMTAYQGQLEELGYEGLGLRPRIHPRAKGSGDVGGQFVGSAKCGECHKTAFGIWSKTRHAQATQSLAKASPPRLHDPECLSCHVTGWSPQEFTPYESGFKSLAETALLGGNGCENCHGPGGGHVAAEAGRDLVQRDKMRQAMRLTQATVELNLCAKCHDGDNDPHFDGHFKTYWPKVEHKGMK